MLRRPGRVVVRRAPGGVCRQLEDGVSGSLGLRMMPWTVVPGVRLRSQPSGEEDRQADRYRSSDRLAQHVAPDSPHVSPFGRCRPLDGAPIHAPAVPCSGGRSRAAGDPLPAGDGELPAGGGKLPAGGGELPAGGGRLPVYVCEHLSPEFRGNNKHRSRPVPASRRRAGGPRWLVTCGPGGLCWSAVAAGSLPDPSDGSETGTGRRRIEARSAASGRGPGQRGGPFRVGSRR